MSKRSKGRVVLDDLRQVALKQGFMTIDQIENAMDLETNIDLMDEVYIMLGKMKIEVFDSEKDAQEKIRKVQKQEEKKTEARAVASQVLRYDDPVRMYLREMGRVPLLDREGEVEIAKRIENGGRKIRMAVFQSPTCLKDLLVLAERIEQEKVKLEDVVQLDFGGWSSGNSARKDRARVIAVIHKAVEVQAELSRLRQALSRKLLGHYSYYGLTGNGRTLDEFRHQVVRLWHYWLRRRSQRRSLTWTRFNRLLKRFRLPPPRVVHSIYRHVANPCA